MKVSVFQNCYQTKPASTLSIQKILESIGDTSHERRHLITQIRQCDSKAAKTELKNELSCVTFSGEFNIRNKGGCDNYNGVVVLDFDEIEDCEYTKELAQCEATTLGCFISPSGNGLKIVVKTNNNHVHYHPVAWLRVANRYAEVLGEKIDQSGKDVSRLCYMSFDPSVYYNPNATTFDVGEIRSADVADLNQATQTAPDGTVIAGNRHNYLCSMSQHMANAGCNEQVIRSAIHTTIQDQFDLSDGRAFSQTEIDNIVSSAVKNGEGMQLAVVEAEGQAIFNRLEEAEANLEREMENFCAEMDELDDNLINLVNGSVEKVSLDFTSGIGKELQEAYELRAKKHNPEMDKIGILTLCASLMGSAYQTVNEVRPQIYSMILAPSGGGKGHNIDMAGKVFNEAHDFLPVEDCSSGTAMAIELMNKQSQLFHFDEFHQPLEASCNSQGIGGNMKDMLTLATRLWGVTGPKVVKTFSDSKKNIKAMDPAPSILATSTPDAMRPFICGPLLTNGFMGRFLFYHQSTTGDFSNSLEFSDLDEELQRLVAQYCSVNKPNENEIAINRGFKPEKIPFTREAEVVLGKFRGKVEAIRQALLNPNDTKQNLVVLVERVHQIACKIALIYAWAEHAPPSSDKVYARQFYAQRTSPHGFSINDRHAKIGCYMAMRSLGQLLAYIGDVFGESLYQRNLTHLMHLIRTRGSVGIRLPQLYRVFAHRGSEVEQYIRSLQQMGKVKLDDAGGIPVLYDVRARRAAGLLD